MLWPLSRMEGLVVVVVGAVVATGRVVAVD